MDGFLTLNKSLKTNMLNDFIAQAEEGVEAANREMFEDLVGRVTAPQPEDQTTRSRARGSSRGK